MKIFFGLILLCLVSPLFSQAVLPGYYGYWIPEKSITVFDLLGIPTERLGVLRNEIYARYGRAFKTEKYRNYFNEQSWYKVKPDFNESWLSEQDLNNARTILSVDRPKLGRKQVLEAVLENLEYHEKGNDVFLVFTGKNLLIWSDPYVHGEYMYGERGYWDEYMQRYEGPVKNWVSFGDWIIVYDSGYARTVAAYKLDHKKQLITERIQGEVDPDLMYKYIRENRN